MISFSGRIFVEQLAGHLFAFALEGAAKIANGLTKARCHRRQTFSAK